MAANTGIMVASNLFANELNCQSTCSNLAPAVASPEGEDFKITCDGFDGLFAGCFSTARLR